MLKSPQSLPSKLDGFKPSSLKRSRGKPRLVLRNLYRRHRARHWVDAYSRHYENQGTRNVKQQLFHKSAFKLDGFKPSSLARGSCDDIESVARVEGRAGN